MEATGLPVGLYVQAAGGTALANALVATRVGADVVATAVYPLALALHRSPASRSRGAARARAGHRRRRLAALGRRRRRRRAHRRRAALAARAPDRGTRGRVRPAGRAGRGPRRPPPRARGGRPTARHADGGRPDPRGVRLAAARRADRADPRLAGAPQRPLGAPLRHRAGRVPAARDGWLRRPPAPIEPKVRRAVELLAGEAPSLEEDPPSAEDVREAAEGLASSEEDLVLLAMFGDEAETLLQTIRQRHSREATLLGGDVDAQRAERIRELVKIVQESGVGEIEIEDEGMRVSVRRADEPGLVPGRRRVGRDAERAEEPSPRRDRAVRGVPGRVPDGRHLLPRIPARRAAVRRGRRRRHGRPDALPPRGDEALQRAEGRRRRPCPRDPRRQRAAGRVRHAALRAGAGRRPAGL